MERVKRGGHAIPSATTQRSRGQSLVLGHYFPTTYIRVMPSIGIQSNGPSFRRISTALMDRRENDAGN